MNRYVSARDLTARQPAPSPGLHHYRLHLCGHKGSTMGAKYRPGFGFVLCPACNKGKT